MQRVQFGGDEVVKAKDGAGSATLSMAMAGARFASTVIGAAQGDNGMKEPAFVESPLYADQGIPFFASEITLGPGGVEYIHPVGDITPYEQKLLDVCLKDLKGNIEKGTYFGGWRVGAQSLADFFPPLQIGIEFVKNNP